MSAGCWESSKSGKVNKNHYADDIKRQIVEAHEEARQHSR